MRYTFVYKEWFAGSVYAEYSFTDGADLRPVFAQNWVDDDGYDYGVYGINS